MVSFLLNISDLIFKRKKIIILLWIFLLILSILILVFNKNDNSETELKGVENSEAYKVKVILEKDFNLKLGNSSAIVVNSNIDINTLKNDIKNKFPEISRIFSVPSQVKHKNQLIYIEFSPKYTPIKMQGLTPKIREYLKEWSEKNKIDTYFTGSTAFQYDSKKSGKKDSNKSEFIALLISLIVLIFSFGNIITAFIPIIIGITTIIFLNAFLKFFNISVNPVSQILTGLVGLALAIDYSLFIVSRFKNELKENDKLISLRNSLITSGKTIIYSGLIMIISVSVLLIPDVSITRTVVFNLSIAIFISIINCIFILPALLLRLEKYIDKQSFFIKYLEKSENNNFWRDFSTHVVKFNKLYFLSSLLILLSLSMPILNIKLWSPVINVAPKDAESLQGYNILKEDGWGGELVPINIIISTEKNGIYNKEFINKIYKITKSLEEHPKVSSIQSLTSWNKDFKENDYFSFYSTAYNLKLLGINQTSNPLINEKTGSNMTLINVYPKDLIDLNDTYEIIEFVKDYSKKNNLENKILVGGIVSRVNDFTKELYSYIPQMLLIIFIGIYILLFLHLKSIFLPIKAAIMNFLPILSSFGILVLVFQYGYLHNILDTPFNKAVTNIVPIVLFCIVFGLSMDYEVLILSNISENYEKNKSLNDSDNNKIQNSIVEGMSKSSRIITSAALILIGVFIPGVFSQSPQIQEICIGISSAILIDATIVRLFLVPSFMMLMGKLNWWNPFKKL